MWYTICSPLLSFGIASFARNIRSIDELQTEIDDMTEDNAQDRSEQQRNTFVFSKMTLSDGESIVKSVSTRKEKESSTTSSIAEMIKYVSPDIDDESHSVATQLDRDNLDYDFDFESISSGFQKSSTQSARTSDESTMTYDKDAIRTVDQGTQTAIMLKIDAYVMTEGLSKSQLRAALLGQIGFIKKQFEAEKVFYQDLVQTLNK